MDYDDNFNKAFQDHDLLETTSTGTPTKNENRQDMYDRFCHVVVKKSARGLQKQNGKRSKKVKKQDMYLTMYSSGLTGTNIRDAITGAYYKELVGSAAQDLFFKVTIATGEFPGSPLHLFYLSPELYERHQECELDDTLKNNWYEKSEKARAKLRV